MKRTIESKIYDNENYTIYTEEYVESGIFFQNPIQERTFDTDPFEDNHFDFYDFQAKWNGSVVFRFIHTLLGNKKQMDAIREGGGLPYDVCGVNLRTFVSPIYTKREGRSLNMYAKNLLLEIQEIHSSGYELPYTRVSGDCHVETTQMTTRTDRKLKYKYGKQYHFTYAHIVKDLLNSLVVKN